MRVWLLATLVCVLASLAPGSASALSRDEVQALREAFSALHELRVEEAAATAERMRGTHPDDADVLSLSSQVAFHRGAYAQALTWMEASIARRPLRTASGQEREDPRGWLVELMRSTRTATQDFVEARSDDGRYVVTHAPGRDRHLVPYVLRALEGSDAALQDELGVRLPGPIRVEILPDADHLARLSTLTEEQIATTGTIALCKWDKLMVTSPRALLRGYPWMDTIAHEFVHLALSRASRDRAPVWFQEGMAKFLERRWREPEAQEHLHPAARGLLVRAVENDALLPFDRIHPSIALLPSQEDAALAFAQVSTFIARFHAAYGKRRLQAAVARIAEGEDAREALAAVAEVPWATLERNWRRSLASLRASDAPPLLERTLRGGDDEASEERAQVAEAARRNLRLGDMLWSRRRYRAAAVEYRRALDAAPNDPRLAARFAAAALEGGQPADAASVLGPFAERFPDHAPTQAVLARALREMGEAERSREVARAAIRLNPFDPSPHCDLAVVGEDEATRVLEARQCAALGGSP